MHTARFRSGTPTKQSIVSARVSRSRVVLVAGFVSLATAIAACSPDNPINQMLGKAGLTCVDALGPNSTSEQIADASLNTQFTDPVTGETKTGMDMAVEAGRPLEDIWDLPEQSRDDIQRKAAEAVFSDVPDGGDAAFAASVCDTVNGGVWKALTSQGTPEDTLASTPHLLRGLGRMVCGSIDKESYYEVVFKEDADLAQKAKKDPEAFKSTQLAKMREQLKSIQEAAATNSKLYKPGAADAQQKEIDNFAATPATDIAKNVEGAYRMVQLAVEHLCPNRTRYGFGPGCGQFNPYPDGDSTGVLRVRQGNLSCDDAQTVIRNYYFPGQVDPQSPLSMYYCEDGGVKADKKPLVYVECEAIEGNPNPATILVSPE